MENLQWLRHFRATDCLPTSQSSQNDITVYLYVESRRERGRASISPKATEPLIFIIGYGFSCTCGGSLSFRTCIIFSKEERTDHTRMSFLAAPRTPALCTFSRVRDVYDRSVFVANALRWLPPPRFTCMRRQRENESPDLRLHVLPGELSIYIHATAAARYTDLRAQVRPQARTCILGRESFNIPDPNDIINAQIVWLYRGRFILDFPTERRSWRFKSVGYSIHSTARSRNKFLRYPVYILSSPGI